jgi:hypothetical protein
MAPRLGRKLPLREAALVGTVLPLPGLFIARWAFDAIGGFTPLRMSADWILLIELSWRYQVECLHDVTVRIREHPGRSMRDSGEVTRYAVEVETVIKAELGKWVSDAGERTRFERLLEAGVSRLAGAHDYGDGDMRSARRNLNRVVALLGAKEGLPLVWRVWMQTWLGSKGSVALRRARTRVESLRASRFLRANRSIEESRTKRRQGRAQEEGRN